MKKVILFFMILLQVFMLFSCQKDEVLPIDTDGVPRDFGYAVQYVRADGGFEADSETVLHVIRSKKELDVYYDNAKNTYQLGDDFIDACSKYNDTYFEKQLLLIVIVEEPSGSNRHKVRRIHAVDGETTVEIERILPEFGDDDMASWHILIEPEAGFDAEEKEINVLLDGKSITEKKEKVKHSLGYANISLDIPEGWEYVLEDEGENKGLFSILYRPEGMRGGVRVCYVKDFWITCGTGLITEQINVGRYIGTKGGYYDEPWYYISIQDVPGKYYILREDVGDWWSAFGDKAMEILDSLIVADGCLPSWRALPVAEKFCTVDYNSVGSSFEHTDGSWRFLFYDKSFAVMQTVVIYPDGSSKVF